jgi:hypothetical protein
MKLKCLKTLFWLQLLGIHTGCQPEEKQNQESGNPDSIVDSGAESKLIKQVNVLPTESNPLARYVEVELIEKASVSLEFWRSDGPHFERKFAPIDTHHLLPLIGLTADSTIHLVVHAKSDNDEEATEILSFETEPLPFPALDFLIPVAMEPDGVITVFAVPSDEAPDINASYVGVDRAGEVVWIGRNEHITSGAKFLEPSFNQSFVDLSPQSSNGISSYATLNITSDVVATVQTPLTLHHDLSILPNGNMVGLVKEARKVLLQNGQSKTLKGDKIVELDPSGQVVWKWSSFDYLDPSSFIVPENGTNNWTHANNVQYLPETDELLVGFRNLNLLVTIDRSTSAITRRFGENGDYTLTNGQWFYGQHHSTLQDDGTLTIYDNHYDEEVNANSRVVQYRINESAKTIEELWTLDLGYFYRSGGEATPLENGGALIAAGGKGGTNNIDTIIQVFEIDANQREVWRVQLSKTSLPVVYRTSRLVSGTRMAPEDQTPSE